MKKSLMARSITSPQERGASASRKPGIPWYLLGRFLYGWWCHLLGTIFSRTGINPNFFPDERDGSLEFGSRRLSSTNSLGAVLIQALLPHIEFLQNTPPKQ